MERSQLPQALVELVFLHLTRPTEVSQVLPAIQWGAQLVLVATQWVGTVPLRTYRSHIIPGKGAQRALLTTGASLTIRYRSGQIGKVGRVGNTRW